MNLKGFEPRPYQVKIASNCIDNNSLVVLPTGLGKTKIAILVAIEKLNKFQNSKVVIVAPTRPLAAQIQKEFQEHTDLENDKIILVTGLITVDKRKNAYKGADIIIGTPQTIDNDLDNEIIDPKQISLLILDEVHRAVKNYAHANVVKKYRENNNNARVLGLTASPGSDKKKIDEIVKNLGVSNVEIYSEDDLEVKDYVQKKDIEFVNVAMPVEMKNLSEQLRSIYKNKISRLSEFSYLKNKKSINKRDILAYQRYLQKELSQGNTTVFYQLSLSAQLLKLAYCIEMFETQGTNSFIAFVDKMHEDKSKAAKNLLEDPVFMSIFFRTKELVKVGLVHPKLDKLKSILIEYLKVHKEMRVIIFANFRNTTKELFDLLSTIDGLNPIELVGQKEGLKQSEQIKRIEDFSEGKYNCLITTSIGEEGLSIKGADLAIFYDQTSMGVRRIQRGGRVGRVRPGKIIYLITKGTSDESLYWASHYGVKKMKTILTEMKKETSLVDFND